MTQTDPTLADGTDSAALMTRALRLVQLFSTWPDARLAQLIRSARLHRYTRRTQLLSDDRHKRELLAVVSGCLEISSSSAQGRKYVNTLLGAGQVAPLVRLLDDVPLPYDYHAHEDSVIVHLPCDAVIAVLDAEPVLWRGVAQLALQRQRQSVALLQNQMLAPVRARVAATLLSLAQIYGAQDQGGLDLRVRLSQNDLAAMLSLSRQTINKELGRLVEEAVIERRYKHITIVDGEALRRIAALP
ncbi:Crp/Fnr family transcriptional regulator [Pseudorhodoferax soli]|uniref:Crp/Fnr family transcriptional regulator n=1 Tax=Pseudorhodoferax soli TaxID=545864 RepID=A0A368XRX9_9BURK|nr:Crp/Fnr family transcriptional regulator [Pseudorhodoferax soli]RCW68764.1 Crp/Fnr family transcriptional regulator [Pseudorhodoferax soli]